MNMIIICCQKMEVLICMRMFLDPSYLYTMLSFFRLCAVNVFISEDGGEACGSFPGKAIELQCLLTRYNTHALVVKICLSVSEFYQSRCVIITQHHL